MHQVTKIALAPLVVALGCSTGANEAGLDGGGPTDGSWADARLRDAAVDAFPADGSVCVPGGPPTFQPPAYRPATGAHQGSCTSSQIAAVFTACLATTATPMTCAAYSGASAPVADKACAACVITHDTDVKYGPVVEASKRTSINVAGCMELVDPVGGLACAKAYQSKEDCGAAACVPMCFVGGDWPPGYSSYEACVEAAYATGCKTFADDAACAGAEADGGAAAICFQGQTFQDLYTVIAPIFCGGATDAAAD